MHAGHDRRRGGRTAVVIALAALLVAPGSARANGDPASHWLLVQDVFFPFERKLSDPLKRELVATVEDANENGYPVKTAVINTRSDLGTVGDLFGQPQEYAEYLGSQLGIVFEGHLLIAMPQGLGITQAGGRPPPAAVDVVRTIPVGRGPDATGEAAVVAVERLAETAGSDGGFPVLLVVVAVLTVVGVAAVGALVVVARRRARAAA